jgi:hypothetical protein
VMMLMNSFDMVLALDREPIKRKQWSNQTLSKRD